MSIIIYKMKLIDPVTFLTLLNSSIAMCSGKQLNGLIRNELAALVLIRLTVDGEIQLSSAVSISVLTLVASSITFE